MSDVAGAPGIDRRAAGAWMHALAEELYPICRSITGEGTRRTLRRLAQEIPLTLHEVPSGTAVLDWTIPAEWNIDAAWIEDPSGRRLVDLSDHALHVVSYSVPIDGTFTFEELRPRLFTIPEHPDWIPYRTSYYAETWGFCLTQRQLERFGPGPFRVRIDSRLAPGSLTYGELVLPGDEPTEVLLSAHVCHPQLANDNLSGVVVATLLGRMLQERRRRFTYRLLFAPGTIGALTWLARNPDAILRVGFGLTLASLGDPGVLHYKRSRRETAAIDRIATHALRARGREHRLLPFEPLGYDERQYCSPGFDLPVGALSRTPWGRYPEYHSSADDLTLIRPESLADALEAILDIIEMIESNRAYVNASPRGEPQLGRRGLYRQTGGRSDARQIEQAMLWVLNYSDGQHDLLDIAERAAQPWPVMVEAARLLEEAQLLARAQIAARRGGWR